MTAVLDHPTTSAAVAGDRAYAPSPPPPPRRRLARFLAVAAIVATAGTLGVTAGSWGVRWNGDVPMAATGAPRLTELADLGERGTYVLEYLDGAPVTLTIPLRNDGLLPTTVTSVRLTDEVRPLIEVGPSAQLPLTLGPGEEIELQITARLDNCEWYHERAIQRYPSALITSRTLGRSVTKAVPLRHELIVHAPMIVGCPDGKLDRTHYNRSDIDR